MFTLDSESAPVLAGPAFDAGAGLHSSHSPYVALVPQEAHISQTWVSSSKVPGRTSHLWSQGGGGDGEDGSGTFRNNPISQHKEEQSPVAGETSHTRCRRLGLGDVSTSEPTAWTALSRHCAKSENQSLFCEGASSLQRKNMHMSSDHDEFRNITANTECEDTHST